MLINAKYTNYNHKGHKYPHKVHYFACTLRSTCVIFVKIFVLKNINNVNKRLASIVFLFILRFSITKHSIGVWRYCNAENAAFVIASQTAAHEQWRLRLFRLLVNRFIS